MNSIIGAAAALMLLASVASGQVTTITADEPENQGRQSQVSEVTAGGVSAPDKATPATLQEILNKNKAILEQQSEILKQLEVLKEQARQTRIFSSRS